MRIRKAIKMQALQNASDKTQKLKSLDKTIGLC